MHASLFDVFHHAGNDHIFSIADAVDVNLNGIFEESVDQHRLSLCNGKGLGNVPFKLDIVVANLHRPATKHKAGTHQRGIPNSRNLPAGLLQCPRNATGRLLELQTIEELAKFFSIFGLFNRIDRSADDRQTGRCQRPGKIQRRLSTELYDHAIGIDAIGNVEHVLAGERLKEEHVAGIVVRADRFGV